MQEMLKKLEFLPPPIESEPTAPEIMDKAEPQEPLPDSWQTWDTLTMFNWCSLNRDTQHLTRRLNKLTIAPRECLTPKPAKTILKHKFHSHYIHK